MTKLKCYTPFSVGVKFDLSVSENTLNVPDTKLPVILFEFKRHNLYREDHIFYSSLIIIIAVVIIIIRNNNFNPSITPSVWGLAREVGVYQTVVGNREHSDHPHN